jgi:BirA family biotin operon repressor/biotin-[acetyl-CoA-carboxylase] ligase
MSLTFSIIYKTDFLPAIRQFGLNIAISLGVAEALRAHSPRSEWSVKWPNDILAGKQKVAGILIENTIQGGNLQYSIIGIGINVNQASFTAELPNAGSLRMAEGCILDTGKVFDTVLRKIEAYFIQLRNEGTARLKEKYQEMLLGYGKKMRFKDGEGEFIGTITGVNDQGQLLVLKGGRLCKYDMKRIEFLFD